MVLTRRRRLWLAVSVVAAVVVAASIPVIWRLVDKPDSAQAQPVPIGTADLSGSGPGSLVSASTMPGFSRTADGSNVTAARVVYRSTNGDSGRETVVSGSVFTPTGPIPDGGWPVVAFGHPNIGINEPCGPSRSDSLLGMGRWVQTLVHDGYAVAFADYEGLGAPGMHPLTDNRTAGFNVIDSVRALRHTFKGVSNRWAAFGGSQGGGAVWAANEQAAKYAPELELVGAVAAVPAADLSGQVDKALAGTLTTDQILSLQAIIESLARLHPDLNRDDYRRGAVARYWDILSSCSGPEVLDRTRASRELKSSEIAPANPAAAERLRDYMRAWAVPQGPLSAPLYVVYGGRDTHIDPQWVTDAVARACALGGIVDSEFQPDGEHNNIQITKSLAWIHDRFEGKPVVNECP
jgi:Secretory lipase